MISCPQCQAMFERRGPQSNNMTTLIRILCLLLLASTVQAQLAPKLRGFRNLRIAGRYPIGNPISFWSFDESSISDTPRLDSVDSHDFSEAGEVPTAVGHLGGAAGPFDGGLLATAGWAFDGTFSWSFAGWVYFDNIGAGGTPLALYPGANASWFDVISTGTYLQWRVTTNQTDITTTVTSAWPLTNGVWYFIACGNDVVNDTIWISVNNETVVTASCPVDFTCPASATLRFGVSRLIEYFQGRVDAWSYWPRKLEASDINYLWNGGAGRNWPF